MNEDDAIRITAILQELRDGQKLQLERQLEALEIQRQQFAIFQESAARAERIQGKAELMQDRGVKLVQWTRKFAAVLLLIVFVLIVYVSWLLFTLRH